MSIIFVSGISFLYISSMSPFVLFMLNEMYSPLCVQMMILPEGNAVIKRSDVFLISNVGDLTDGVMFVSFVGRKVSLLLLLLSSWGG